MIKNELKELFLDRKSEFEDILGQNGVKKGLKSALLAGRHVIVLGPPGIGKTTLAKNLARMLPEATVVCGR